MPITWTYTLSTKTQIEPKIYGKEITVNQNFLALDNPWVTDSVTMSQVYTAMILGVMLTVYPNTLTDFIEHPETWDATSLAIDILLPFIFAPFLAYRIYLIKKLSKIYFHRKTQSIYCRRGKKLFTLDWKTIHGGMLTMRVFYGNSWSISYALALACPRRDGSLHQRDCVWIDSNRPHDPAIRHVEELWEYLRHYMEHGPDKLPPPGPPNWWHRPMHAISLTPAEAWRHYVPWRTGEPGEMQGKKNWQLPFWAIVFPLTFPVAVCWYIICKAFNVKAAPVPPEAFALK